MTLGEFYKFVNFVTRKERSGKISPSEFNLVMPVVILEYFAKLVGLEEQYSVNAPIPAIAKELSAGIKDSLRPFYVRMGHNDIMPLIVNSEGQATIPADYCHYSSFTYRYVKNNISTYKTIDVLMDFELSRRLDSSIMYPTLKNPVCSFYSDYIQFYPEHIKFVNMTYLRYPANPVYGYTIVNDEEVYNPLTSTEIEFPDADHFKIANLMLKKIGINLKDGLIMQYAEQQKQMGV